MKIKVILVLALATLSFSCSTAQKARIMEEKQVAIREQQVEINYFVAYIMIYSIKLLFSIL